MWLDGLGGWLAHLRLRRRRELLLASSMIAMAGGNLCSGATGFCAIQLVLRNQVVDDDDDDDDGRREKCRLRNRRLNDVSEGGCVGCVCVC